MPTTRRLAAILAADVAGYSRLMGRDEEGTLALLKSHRRELVDAKIKEHRGRIVKTTGDGLLVEFASVIDAVRCAVEWQRGMIERNSNARPERSIVFRIGINLGDVIADGRDIFGDGVNIAARLEALAEPGGVCISGTVRDHIGDRLPYTFDDIGEQSVKNIARPVRAFVMPSAAAAATPLVTVMPAPRRAASRSRSARPQRAGANPAPRLSVVVLPFANLSSDPEQEYFVEAVTDDLTTDLSRIRGSFVISRTTASSYKGKAIDVKDIGRDLGVRYALEGSLRRLGEQVQVNVQLIDAEDGAHIWADRFDAARANLAQAQSQITSRLARSLHLALLEAVSRRIEREAPATLDAADLVIRGWAEFLRPVTAARLQAAQQAFEQALVLDPQSPDARVGIASMLNERLTLGWSKPSQQDFMRSEVLLTEALEHDRNYPWALTEMGKVRRLQGRLPEAQIAFEKALALDPGNTRARNQLGITLLFLGQPQAAIPHIEKSLQLNPNSQNLHYQLYWMGIATLCWATRMRRWTHSESASPRARPRICSWRLHSGCAARSTRRAPRWPRQSGATRRTNRLPACTSTYPVSPARHSILRCAKTPWMSACAAPVSPTNNAHLSAVQVSLISCRRFRQARRPAAKSPSSHQRRTASSSSPTRTPGGMPSASTSRPASGKRGGFQPSAKASASASSSGVSLPSAAASSAISRYRVAPRR